NDPNLFSLKVNHEGGFSYVYGPKRTRDPRRVYKGRNADWFDDVDADGFSVIEVSGMLKELGYENLNIKILYKKPTSDPYKGLEPLSKDIDVLELLSCMNKFKLNALFIEPPVDRCVIDKSVIDLDQEDNSVIDGLKSSNACLETNECEALENDNAGLGTNEGEGIENNNAGLETQKSEGIDNDNVEELDPLFSYPNTNHQKGQSKWVGSTEPQPQVENNDQFVYEECDLEEFDSDIDPDDDEAERKKALKKITTGQYGDQCVVNVEERSCSCRKWDLTWMPCKHAVAAIYNMAENRLEPGIPETWVHQSYWLKTWEEMYRFKINPCNGPDLWPPSDSLVILTPPDYRTPIGRPPKKRKKSAAELYDVMVKDGKLSRAGKTVTCKKCGQKGHNSRSCKDQRGGQSTGTPMPNQGPS
nr:hypothetical protein [Tanacetum cinerariifolium]